MPFSILPHAMRHIRLAFSFNHLQFVGRTLTVTHYCHPAVWILYSTILLLVGFCWCGLLFQSKTVKQSSSLFFLITCLIQIHLRHLFPSLGLFTTVLSMICKWGMVWGNFIVLYVLSKWEVTYVNVGNSYFIAVESDKIRSGWQYHAERLKVQYCTWHTVCVRYNCQMYFTVHLLGNIEDQ